jgi:hypothetical protein
VSLAPGSNVSAGKRKHARTGDAGCGVPKLDQST